MVTGHGLKTVEALTGTVGPSVTIAPTLEAFEAAVDGDQSMLRSPTTGARPEEFSR